MPQDTLVASPRTPTAPAWLSGILCWHTTEVNRHADECCLLGEGLSAVQHRRDEHAAEERQRQMWLSKRKITTCSGYSPWTGRTSSRPVNPIEGRHLFRDPGEPLLVFRLVFGLLKPRELGYPVAARYLQ
jgi:hypothetical protein